MEQVPEVNSATHALYIYSQVQQEKQIYFTNEPFVIKDDSQQQSFPQSSIKLLK